MEKSKEKKIRNYFIESPHITGIEHVLPLKINFRFSVEETAVSQK